MALGGYRAWVISWENFSVCNVFISSWVVFFFFGGVIHNDVMTGGFCWWLAVFDWCFDWSFGGLVPFLFGPPRNTRGVSRQDDQSAVRELLENTGKPLFRAFWYLQEPSKTTSIPTMKPQEDHSENNRHDS